MIYTCINYWRALCGRSLIVWRCFNKRSSHLRRLFLSWTSKTYNLTARYPCVLHIPLLVMGIGSRCKVVAMKRIVEMLKHRSQDFTTFLKWKNPHKKKKRSPLGKIVMMFFFGGKKRKNWALNKSNFGKISFLSLHSLWVAFCWNWFGPRNLPPTFFPSGSFKNQSKESLLWQLVVYQ